MTTYEPGTATLTQEGDIWVLTLTGEHDLTTIAGLDDDMERIAASGTSVVIDLSPATFIDSRVIAWLLRWWKRSCESTHLHLAVATGRDTSPVTRLFELVSLADVLPYYPTTSDALHHLDTPAPSTRPVHPATGSDLSPPTTPQRVPQSHAPSAHHDALAVIAGTEPSTGSRR